MKIIIYISFLILSIGISGQCLPEGITFTTQQEVDAFSNNYPDCIEIQGDVNVFGNVTNLNSLSQITKINGTLFIENNTIINLSGLDNLYSLGSLHLYNSYNLNDISALESITELESCSINNMSSLDNLNGLNSLSIINNNLTLESSTINDISALSNLLSIGGNFNINRLPITSFSSLSSLTTINGNFEFDSLYELTDVELNSLSVIGGEFNLVGDGMGHLTSITGLNNLQTVGSLSISSFSALENLNGLSSIENITGTPYLYSGLIIDNCNLLNDLSGLNIEFIDGLFAIANNDSLTSFNGVEDLNYISKCLYIGDNLNLNDIDALQNIDGSTLTTIYEEEENAFVPGVTILNNTLLSNCSIESICFYINADSNETYFDNNLMGCNSREEVESTCGNLGTLDTSIQFISVNPNPVSKELKLDVKENINIQVYNILGEMIDDYSISPRDNIIDLSEYEKGVYLLKNKNNIIKKIIVN